MLGAPCFKHYLTTKFDFRFFSAKAVGSMASLSNDGNIRLFVHPYMQAWGMFAGEIGCLVVYLIYRQRRLSNRMKNGSKIGLYDPVLDGPKFKPFLFFVPAMLDLTSTCISYTALTLTYASSYQMLKSAAIVFTAFLTQFVLKTSISLIRWLGVLFIACGLITVGVTGKILSLIETRTISKYHIISII